MSSNFVALHLFVNIAKKAIIHNEKKIASYAMLPTYLQPYFFILSTFTSDTRLTN